METQELIKRRVAAGLAWIKENAERLDLDPRRVDLDTVNVSNDTTCVVAQSGGRMFGTIMNAAGNPDDSDAWIRDHGFGVSFMDDIDEDDVVAEWRRVLAVEQEVTAL